MSTLLQLDFFYVNVFFFKSKNVKKISIIWCHHLAQPKLLNPTFII